MHERHQAEMTAMQDRHANEHTETAARHVQELGGSAALDKDEAPADHHADVATSAGPNAIPPHEWHPKHSLAREGDEGEDETA